MQRSLPHGRLNYFMSKKIRFAFITGTSRDIGCACAFRLADYAFDSCLGCHSNHNAAQEVKDLIGANGRFCAKTVAMDRRAINLSAETIEEFLRKQRSRS